MFRDGRTMMHESHWYFAYGSNMQAATFRGRRRLEPLQVRVGYLKGFELCFDLPIGPGGRGVANLRPCEEAGLWGVLYLLTGDQHDHLDRTEGVPSGLYRRIDVPIEADREVLTAGTLISDRRDASRLPSHRYLGLLLDGAREHGLPPDWVATLKGWPLAWDERKGATNPPGLRPRR